MNTKPILQYKWVTWVGASETEFDSVDELILWLFEADDVKDPWAVEAAGVVPMKVKPMTLKEEQLTAWDLESEKIRSRI